MYIPDIRRVIEQISRDKGIDAEILVKAIEEALKSAAKKKFGSKIDIEVKYNEDMGEIEVFQFREVVKEITEPETQITFEEGCRLDPECELGDSLGTKIDTSTFGRIAAQSAKQVIIQKMKDAEREAVYSGFIERKGEIINGIVQRIERGNIIVNLGQTEGILPDREQVPKENYRRGDRIRAFIMDVRYDTRGPQIVLSRTHPNFLINLFRTEVPEISEGIVSIMGAAREPGIRAKFAVASNDSDIDPVGACVGMKGSRVQNVVQELRGEKIDIIPWHVDPAKFVCNALAPAEISRVIIDEENRSMEVIVPDEFLSVAIGKGGQNVRLASKLTRWRLDVKNETRYSEDMQDGYDSLMVLPGMTISLADALYEKGFFSAEELSKGSVEDLIQVRDITEEGAVELIRVARKYLSDPESLSEEISDQEEVGDEDNSDSENAPNIQNDSGQDNISSPNEDDGQDDTPVSDNDSQDDTPVSDDEDDDVQILATSDDGQDDTPVSDDEDDDVQILATSDDGQDDTPVSDDEDDDVQILATSDEENDIQDDISPVSDDAEGGDVQDDASPPSDGEDDVREREDDVHQDAAKCLNDDDEENTLNPGI